MISKEVNKLFSDLVRAGLFLPNADGTKAFAHLLGQITMKGQPKLYGHKIMLKKRKKMNRYDKFSKNFYARVQKAFFKIAKTDKKKYIIIDNSLDTPETEKKIFNKFFEVLNK